MPQLPDARVIVQLTPTIIPMFNVNNGGCPFTERDVYVLVCVCVCVMMRADCTEKVPPAAVRLSSVPRPVPASPPAL
jgi:hypothetical protein